MKQIVLLLFLYLICDTLEEPVKGPLVIIDPYEDLIYDEINVYTFDDEGEEYDY